MTINIKHPKADKLARTLSKLTGHSITAVIIEALQEKLAREQGRATPLNLEDEIIAIGQRCASLPDLDKRTPNQIIGYNKHGY